jgi:hypothetical protein
MADTASLIDLIRSDQVILDGEDGSADAEINFDDHLSEKIKTHPEICTSEMAAVILEHCLNPSQPRRGKYFSIFSILPDLPDGHPLKAPDLLMKLCRNLIGTPPELINNNQIYFLGIGGILAQTLLLAKPLLDEDFFMALNSIPGRFRDPNDYDPSAVYELINVLMRTDCWRDPAIAVQWQLHNPIKPYEDRIATASPVVAGEIGRMMGSVFGALEYMRQEILPIHISQQTVTILDSVARARNWEGLAEIISTLRQYAR